MIELDQLERQPKKTAIIKVIGVGGLEVIPSIALSKQAAIMVSNASW